MEHTQEISNDSSVEAIDDTKSKREVIIEDFSMKVIDLVKSAREIIATYGSEDPTVIKDIQARIQNIAHSG